MEGICYYIGGMKCECVCKHGCRKLVVNEIDPKLRNDEEPLPSHSSFLRCNLALRRDCTLCCSNSPNLARIESFKSKHDQLSSVQTSVG